MVIEKSKNNSFRSTQLVISDSLTGHCQALRHVARISEWKSRDIWILI